MQERPTYPMPDKNFQIARFTVEANRCMCTHMVFCIILFSIRGKDNGARSTSWVVRLGNVVASAMYTAEAGWPVSVLVRATEQAISAFGTGQCRNRKCWSKDSLRGRLTKSSHVMLTKKNSCSRAEVNAKPTNDKTFPEPITPRSASPVHSLTAR